MQSTLRACGEAPADDAQIISVEVDANDLPRLALGISGRGMNLPPTMKRPTRLPEPPCKAESMSPKMIGKMLDTSPAHGRSQVVTCNENVQRRRTARETTVPPDANLKFDLESTALFLELTFESKGTERQFQVHRRCLGVEFSKRANGPTKISKVTPNCYAKELGLEKDMILKSVGRIDVITKTFDETQAFLKSALMSLPEDA